MKLTPADFGAMTIGEFGQRLEGWLLEDDLAWDRTARLAAVMFNAVTGKPGDPRQFRPPRKTGRTAEPTRHSVQEARADLQALKRELRHQEPTTTS